MLGTHADMYCVIVQSCGSCKDLLHSYARLSLEVRLCMQTPGKVLCATCAKH